MGDETTIRLDRLERDVLELRADYKGIIAGLSRIELEIARFPKCAAPNTCLTLAENLTRITKVVEEIDHRLRGLESNKDEFLGGAKMFTAICTALGVAAGWVFHWLLKKP